MPARWACHAEAMSEADAARHGEYKVPGGKLVVVDLTVKGGALRGVQVSGDFFLEPDSLLDTINAALEGAPTGLDEAAYAGQITQALPQGAVLLGLTPEGVAVAVVRALS